MVSLNGGRSRRSARKSPCSIWPLRLLVMWALPAELKSSKVTMLLLMRLTVPAVLFYLLYVVGVLIFVSGATGTTWQSTLLYGALFGLFCYATFDLTALALLKHWSWPVAFVDIGWGAVVTAVSSTAGLLAADRFT